MWPPSPAAACYRCVLSVTLFVDGMCVRATCKVAQGAPVTGRHLLQPGVQCLAASLARTSHLSFELPIQPTQTFVYSLQDKVHVMAGLETKNAEATVSALRADTVVSLMAPAGVAVVPGSVKATLGAPVIPTETPPATADAAASGTPAEADAPAAESSSSGGGGGSNTGAIVGAVVGVLVGVAAVGGGTWVSGPECWGRNPIYLAAVGGGRCSEQLSAAPCLASTGASPPPRPASCCVFCSPSALLGKQPPR